MVRYLAPVFAGCMLGALTVSVTMLALIEFFDIPDKDFQ